jgi:hypothetical protein
MIWEGIGHLNIHREQATIELIKTSNKSYNTNPISNEEEEHMQPRK